MTDQFSPEYIAYILSDEAKGLQRLWNVQPGDWYVRPTESVPELVTGMILSWDFTACIWLPTLWQLLQIIERAGWGWIRDKQGRWTGYRPKHVAIRVSGSEDMLAAAKLAVRAIGGN
jgi:hypothetical protein